MYIPEDKDQALVETPYGKGMVIRTRKNVGAGKKQRQENTGNDYAVPMREIELTDWVKPESSNGPQRPSMLYSPTKFPSVAPSVDPKEGRDFVVTIFGRGKVLDVMKDENGVVTKVVVQLSSWRLAGRSLVKCYLNPESVQVVRPRTKIYEMSVYEKVEHAQELKKQAAVKFAAKDYGAALQLYAKAVDAVRYVQHKADSTNELRADLLGVMITCSNNAATCCLQLKKWDEASKLAKNALVLLEALFEKKGNSKILQLLNREGVTDSQLFGTWKVKSYLVMARGLAEQAEPQQAMDLLKSALEVTETYKKDGDSMFKQLESQEREIRKLYTACKERLKAERKKEKQRAQAMFGGTMEEKKDTEKKEDSSVDHAAPSQEKSAEEGADEGDAPASPKQDTPRKRRVSFADGSVPGGLIDEDDLDDKDDEPSFMEEHKEALLLLTGLAIGAGIMNLVINSFRRR